MYKYQKEFNQILKEVDGLSELFQSKFFSRIDMQVILGLSSMEARQLIAKLIRCEAIVNTHKGYSISPTARTYFEYCINKIRKEEDAERWIMIFENLYDLLPDFKKGIDRVGQTTVIDFLSDHHTFTGMELKTKLCLSTDGEVQELLTTLCIGTIIEPLQEVVSQHKRDSVQCVEMVTRYQISDCLFDED